MVLLMATCELDPAEIARARRALEDCVKLMEWRKLNHFDANRSHGKDVVLEAQDTSFLWNLVKDQPDIVKLASLVAKECDEVLKRGGTLDGVGCMIDACERVAVWYRPSRIRVVGRAKASGQSARTVRLRAGSASKWKTTRPDGTRSRSTSASSARKNRARPRPL